MNVGHGRLQVEYYSADFLKKYVDTRTALFEGSPGVPGSRESSAAHHVAFPSLSLFTVLTLIHALRMMSFSALVDLSDSDLYTKNVSIFQNRIMIRQLRTRTRTNTFPNGTKANAAG